jgi:hypothetical protein
VTRHSSTIRLAYGYYIIYGKLTLAENEHSVIVRHCGLPGKSGLNKKRITDAILKSGSSGSSGDFSAGLD